MNIITKDKNGNILSKGSQFIYTRGELYDNNDVKYEFNRTPLSKQSSQYAYSNENPISILAQLIKDNETDSEFEFGTDLVMLMSGSMRNTETKIFFGPRTVHYNKMILYDDSGIETTFSGSEFEEVLNTYPSRFIALIYTQTAKNSSYELDLHTDKTTYDEDAIFYSSLDYKKLNNYPHFNQIKYSNRIVSKDDFVSSSMGINNTIHYEPDFSNYYIRPDFVKAFKGFKIQENQNPKLSIDIRPNVLTDGTGSSTTNYALTEDSNIYYKNLYWRISPNIAGIKLDPLTSTITLDHSVFEKQGLGTGKIRLYTTNYEGMDSKVDIEIPRENPRFSQSTNTIYVINPKFDSNPWYNILDYVDSNDFYRFEVDSYSLSTDSEGIEIDNSNYRFRINEDFTNGSIKFTYIPLNNQFIELNYSVEKIDTPFELNDHILTSKLKVLEWIICKESKVKLKSSDDYSCTLEGEGLILIKAYTLHGIHCFEEVI